MYTVYFYTSQNKTSPISDFLDSCKLSLRAKIIRQLKYIEEYGLNRAVPNIKKISRTPFWELRILGKDNIRIICIPLSNNSVKILHIFKKKKRKTPIKEIKTAFERQKRK